MSSASSEHTTRITSIESSISTITNVNNEQGTNIATLQNSVSEINTTITSAELSAMVDEKFTKDTVRDGGMWRDEVYTPFVNEDNVRDGYAGTEKPHVVVNNP